MIWEALIATVVLALGASVMSTGEVNSIHTLAVAQQLGDEQLVEWTVLNEVIASQPVSSTIEEHGDVYRVTVAQGTIGSCTNLEVDVTNASTELHDHFIIPTC